MHWLYEITADGIAIAMCGKGRVRRYLPTMDFSSLLDTPREFQRGRICRACKKIYDE